MTYIINQYLILLIRPPLSPPCFAKASLREDFSVKLLSWNLSLPIHRKLKSGKEIVVSISKNQIPLCLNCGYLKLCDAHILPAALGKDIIKSTGKSLSLLAPDRKGVSQSGLFDPNILCSTCDGFLGNFDRHAIEIVRLVGTNEEEIDRNLGFFTLSYNRDINHDYLALFGAAVVWRASVSRKFNFSLGNNQDWFRDIIFRKTTEFPIVTIARLVGENPLTHRAAMDALMYPVRIKTADNISLARFYACGLMFLVQTSRRKHAMWEKGSVTDFGRSRGVANITGRLMPFENLADLKQAKKSKYVQEILARRP